jgi:ATP-dependent Lon protease
MKETPGGHDITLPERLPVLPLRDLVFFPGMTLPLLVGRPGSVEALDAAAAGGGYLLLVAQRDPEVEEPRDGDLCRTGTVTRMIQRSDLADGTNRAVFEGLGRARVLDLSADAGVLTARCVPSPWPDALSEPSPETAALLRRLERAAREYAHLHPDLPDDPAATFAAAEAPDRIVQGVAGCLLVHASDKQRILEAETLSRAAEATLEVVERELEILRIEEKLDREMRTQIDQERRQIYLQEQLRAIHKELGDDDGEWLELEERIAAAGLPEEAHERAGRELGRLRKLSPVAPEAGVIRTYLDWILALPWSTHTTDNANVEHARTVLEQAHYGLDEVKDRILDHIAVLSLVRDIKGPVLCLVGPPGVGKTSLGRSIARALDRRFVRVSLGGVRDEAEIRGHRRTYVGSLPGRIVQGLRQAGSSNPVFLLDEVDKLARDGHGDPTAALLEVLDPEQNSGFRDHYLELEFDVSDVLFLTTANTLAGIPEALRDRMEVIRIPGYLETEKREIGRTFLLPSQLAAHGLEPGSVALDDEALRAIIREYTREAGVRELDRILARLARKLARRRVETPADDRAVQVAARDLRALLGPPPYPRRLRGPQDRVGIATGLAWTAVGGETLDVEVAVVPGSGSIQLTGTLGDVMKESAVAAFTFARARARLLGLRPGFHREVDVHIHIPEGATPKDGPSAGITIAIALISALTGVPTREGVALTGEITLRGRVLPVGGIREKAVAALRMGIDTVILPAGNHNELELLPEEVREGLTLRFAERMDEVFDAVFDGALGIDTDSGRVALVQPTQLSQ